RASTRTARVPSRTARDSARAPRASSRTPRAATRAPRVLPRTARAHARTPRAPSRTARASTRAPRVPSRRPRASTPTARASARAPRARSRLLGEVPADSSGPSVSEGRHVPRAESGGAANVFRRAGGEDDHFVTRVRLCLAQHPSELLEAVAGLRKEALSCRTHFGDDRIFPDA